MVSVVVAVLVQVEDVGEAGEDVAGPRGSRRGWRGGCPGWVAVRVASSVSAYVRSWRSCPGMRETLGVMGSGGLGGAGGGTSRRRPGRSAAVVEGHLVAVGVRERERAAERPVDGR